MKYISKLTLYVVLVVFSIVLTSCANRFGATIHSTYVKVSTVPKSLPFYILSAPKNRLHFGDSLHNIDPSKRKLFSGEIEYSGDSSLLLYREGDYVFVVDCRNFFRRYRATFISDIVNEFTLKCTG